MNKDKQKEFQKLAEKARDCRICEAMCDKTAVLSALNGNLYPKILFIAEAPGRRREQCPEVRPVAQLRGEQGDRVEAGSPCRSEEVCDAACQRAAHDAAFHERLRFMNDAGDRGARRWS